MPSYLPENNTPSPDDTPLRSLHKIAGALYSLVGDQGPSYFVEGSQPTATDNTRSLLQKINAMLGG